MAHRGIGKVGVPSIRFRIGSHILVKMTRCSFQRTLSFLEKSYDEE